MQADKGAKGSTPGPKGQKGSNMSKLQELANVASQENLQDHADTKYHAHQVSIPLLILLRCSCAWAAFVADVIMFGFTVTCRG